MHNQNLKNNWLLNTSLAIAAISKHTSTLLSSSSNFLGSEQPSWNDLAIAILWRTWKQNSKFKNFKTNNQTRHLSQTFINFRNNQYETANTFGSSFLLRKSWFNTSMHSANLSEWKATLASFAAAAADRTPSFEPISFWLMMRRSEHQRRGDINNKKNPNFACTDGLKNVLMIIHANLNV